MLYGHVFCEGRMMAKVLVVDDAVEIVNLLVHILTEQGYEVSTACNGREALEVVRLEQPDAILLDVMMPEMDGIEACRRLKSNADTNAIPVILLTAKDTDEDIVAGLDAGADDYLRKPFSKRVLRPDFGQQFARKKAMIPSFRSTRLFVPRLLSAVRPKKE